MYWVWCGKGAWNAFNWGVGRVYNCKENGARAHVRPFKFNNDFSHFPSVDCSSDKLNCAKKHQPKSKTSLIRCEWFCADFALKMSTFHFKVEKFSLYWFFYMKNLFYMSLIVWFELFSFSLVIQSPWSRRVMLRNRPELPTVRHNKITIEYFSCKQLLNVLFLCNWLL